MFVDFDKPVGNVAKDIRAVFFHTLYPNKEWHLDFPGEKLLECLVQFKNKFGADALSYLITTSLTINFCRYLPYSESTTDLDHLNWTHTKPIGDLTTRIISMDEFYKKVHVGTTVKYLHLLFETYQQSPSECLYLLIRDHILEPRFSTTYHMVTFKLKMLELCSNYKMPLVKYLSLNLEESRTLHDAETTKHYFSLLARFKHAATFYHPYNQHWSVEKVANRFKERKYEMLFALANSGILLENERQEYGELRKHDSGLSLYIIDLQLPLMQKIRVLENALDKNHPLGKVFQITGLLPFFTPSENNPPLKSLRYHLMDLLASKEYRPPVLKGHSIQDDKDGFDSSAPFSL